jgi:hypothetical protein
MSVLARITADPDVLAGNLLPIHPR